MTKAKHPIIREKHRTYSLNCAGVERTRPFNLPTQRVVFICPLCNKTNLDIQPLGYGHWLVRENYTE